MTDDREADHTDAGEGRDVGKGYPEEQPAGTEDDQDNETRRPGEVDGDRD